MAGASRRPVSLSVTPRALADEKRAADAILQKLDLIADRRLRHAELLRRARKALMAGGGFEAADRGERGQGWKP